MASQGLGRLGRNVRTTEVCDKGVSHGVKIVTYYRGHANPYLIENFKRTGRLMLSIGYSHSNYYNCGGLRCPSRTYLPRRSQFSAICQLICHFFGGGKKTLALLSIAVRIMVVPFEAIILLRTH